MEIVLQWLDELDDLVSAGLFKRVLVRSACLVVALAAALATPALLRVGAAAGAALALLNISLAFLIVWACFGALSVRVERQGRPKSGNA